MVSSLQDYIYQLIHTYETTLAKDDKCTHLYLNCKHQKVKQGLLYILALMFVSPIA